MKSKEALKEKIGEDKGFCLLRIKRVARIYGDFIFGKIRFWGCPKIKDSKDSRFWRFAKNRKFGILPKTKAHFWHFPTLVFLGKKGGIL